VLVDNLLPGRTGTADAKGVKRVESSFRFAKVNLKQEG
jgi:hypothetical protein